MALTLAEGGAAVVTVVVEAAVIATGAGGAGFSGGIGGAGGGVLSTPPHAITSTKSHAVRMLRMYSRNAVQGN